MPKSRSGKRSMRVSTLLKKHHGLLKKHSHQVGQSELIYRDQDPSYMTGGYAKPPRKKWDLPDAENSAAQAKTENRQDSQGTQLSDSFFPSFSGLDKAAETLSRDRAIGDQPRSFDGPVREEVGRAVPETHKLPIGYTLFSNIAPEAMPDEKTAQIRGFITELQKIAAGPADKAKGLKRVGQLLSGSRLPALRAKAQGYYDKAKVEYESDTGSESVFRRYNKAVRKVTDLENRERKSHGHAVFGTGAGILGTSAGAGAGAGYAAVRNKKDKKTKIAALQHTAPTAEAITTSANRYDRLSNAKPTVGEAVRGASVGAVLGPAAGLMQRAIAGKKAGGGMGAYRGVRDLAAMSAAGAISGGAIPVVRHGVEHGAEKQKLKGYLQSYKPETGS